MSISTRIDKLESRHKPTIIQVTNLRPSISKEEWLELHSGVGLETDQFPNLFRKILAKRGDGSEIRYSEYLNSLEQSYGGTNNA